MSSRVRTTPQQEARVTLDLTAETAERLRRFLQQHEVGEDDTLRQDVYQPLRGALQVLGQPISEEPFENTRNLIFYTELRSMLTDGAVREIEDIHLSRLHCSLRTMMANRRLGEYGGGGFTLGPR